MTRNDQSTKKQERQPREDKGQEKREAAAKTPGKTNDWDRDTVHGDGDSVGIEPDSSLSPPVRHLEPVRMSRVHLHAAPAFLPQIQRR